MKLSDFGSSIKRLWRLIWIDQSILRSYPEEMDFQNEGIELLPARDQLSHDERIATAAICILHALEGLPPTYCPKGKQNLFVILNSNYYNLILKSFALLNLVSAIFETPPKLYGASSEELIENGFWSIWFQGLINGLCCMSYTIHCFLIVYVYGWHSVFGTAKMILFGVVFLLDVDFFVAIIGDGFHPFRILRPLVFTFTSVQQTMMVACCAYTLKPLVKSFVVLILSFCVFSIVALNLFSGRAPDPGKPGNVFGAACAGPRHPFDNFGEAIISIYTLATTDSHPTLLYPFATCSCTYTAENVTEIWKTEEYCNDRQSAAQLYMISFIVIVNFCLGNSILAVCCYWFEKIMKSSVASTGLQQRFSLVAAFYYLEENGRVKIGPYLECAQFMRRLCPGLPGSREGDKLFFHFIDTTVDGGLEIKEFFKIGDLIRVNITFRKNNFMLSCYAGWSRSALRNVFRRIVLYDIKGIGVLDMIITMIVLVNAVLAGTESTREKIQFIYADITTWIFVLELTLKIGGLGFQTFWLDFWNRLDCAVTVLSIFSFIAEYALSEDNPMFGLVQCLRLLRLIKLVAVLQRTSGKTKRRGSVQITENELLNEKDDEELENLSDVGVDDNDSSGFYKSLLDSFTTTIPVCMNVIILMLFFLYAFALVGMEILYESKANSRSVGVANGVIDFSYQDTFGYDWADLGSALYSLFIIIVGNSWGTVMYVAQEAYGGYLIYVYFIVFHFLSTFLLLNIIQSLFVFTFKTLMSKEDFRTTVESAVRKELAVLSSLSAASFKRLYRSPRLEFLLLSSQELSDEYQQWLRVIMTEKSNLIGYGTKCLPIRVHGSFVTSLNRTRSFKRFQHRASIHGYLSNELGVKQVSKDARAVWGQSVDDDRISTEQVDKVLNNNNDLDNKFKKTKYDSDDESVRGTTNVRRNSVGFLENNSKYESDTEGKKERKSGQYRKSNQYRPSGQYRNSTELKVISSNGNVSLDTPSPNLATKKETSTRTEAESPYQFDRYAKKESRSRRTNTNDDNNNNENNNNNNNEKNKLPSSGHSSSSKLEKRHKDESRESHHNRHSHHDRDDSSKEESNRRHRSKSESRNKEKRSPNSEESREKEKEKERERSRSKSKDREKERERSKSQNNEDSEERKSKHKSKSESRERKSSSKDNRTRKGSEERESSEKRKDKRKERHGSEEKDKRDDK